MEGMDANQKTTRRQTRAFRLGWHLANADGLDRTPRQTGDELEARGRQFAGWTHHDADAFGQGTADGLAGDRWRLDRLREVAQ